MDKHIKTDIENGISYLRVGIIGALTDVINGKESIIQFDAHIPYSIVSMSCCGILSNNLDIKLGIDEWNIRDDEHLITITGCWYSGKLIIKHD